MRRFESYYPCQIPKNGASSYEAPFFYTFAASDMQKPVRSTHAKRTGMRSAEGVDYLRADGRMRLFTSTLFCIMPFSSKNAWSFSSEAMSASVSVS